jgi:ketosteroid isomerase-like protein
LSPPTDLVRRFYDAFNNQDLDAFAETLHPEIVIDGGRGSRTGRDEAREWATFKPGGVQQHQVIDELIEVPEGVLSLNRRQWFWDGTEDLAVEEPMAYLFTLRDGLVSRWQAFEGHESARSQFASPD